MYDIVISSIPYIAYTAPSAAPALLKGHLKSQGFECLAKDLNIEFKNIINNDSVLGELVAYWTSRGVAELSTTANELYQNTLNKISKQFCNFDTKWVGFGVFSDHSHQFLADLLPYIKKHNYKNIKIVIGGHGLNVVYIDSISEYIDHYILGEGELALVELLKGNLSYPGIDSPGVQISQLDQIGFADYSDYDLSAGYDNWYDGPMIQITGSRGCIKDCTFCNVRNIWEKFKYRSGLHIAQEIIQNYESTGIKHFYFTDSLINGNVKELISMMEIITEYKQRTGAPITWGGQWIARSQKGLPKNYYPLIKSSGGFNLTIGVESGSESVRRHMKKYFSNQDLDEEMEQFSQHRIKCGFFIVLGYPTETEEDFKDTLRMFRRYAKYVADGTIVGVTLGGGFYPTENTEIFDSPIMKFYDSRLRWTSLETESNYLQNVRRRIIAQKVVDNLHWPTSDIAYELRPIIHMSGSLFNEESRRLSVDLLKNKQLDVDDEFLIKHEPQDIVVEFSFVGVKGINYPQIIIEINGKIYDKVTVAGEQSYRYTVKDKVTDNTIKISMFNKTNKDTICVDGKILHDMQIKFKEFKIGEVRLCREHLEHYGIVKTAQEEAHYDGLYSNSSYILNFKNPEIPYFSGQISRYFDKQTSSAHLLTKVIELYTQFIS